MIDPFSIGAGLIQGIGSFFTGGAKNALAKKQFQRAKQLRAEEKGILAAPIAQEYKDNKSIAQNKVIAGLPATGLMKNQLANTTADALNRSRLSTTNSGDLLSAVGNINKQQQDANLTLGMKDAEYRDAALGSVSLNNQAIANEKARLEGLAEVKRTDLRKQASALENASTANKGNATQEMVGGVTTGATSILAGLSGNEDADGEGNKKSISPPPSTIPIVTPPPIQDKTPYVPAKNENIYGEITDEERALLELNASSKKRDGLVLPTPEEERLKNGGKIPSVFEISRLKNKAKKK